LTEPKTARRVPTDPLIRDATDNDWVALWPIWHGIVVDGETYAYPADADSRTARALWMEPAPSRVTVAAGDHGVVLGSAKMGPNRPGRGAHIGTASFMVAPAARGLGVGRALAVDMIAWHRAQGYRGIQFNAVVETNTAAVALWRDLGFALVGTVPRAFDSRRHGLVGLHVMYLDLDTPTG